MKQPRLHVCRWSWVIALAAGLGGCSFSDTGLGVEMAPEPPAPERPPAGGGAGRAGAAGAGGGATPTDAGTPAPAPADGGATGAMMPPGGATDAGEDPGSSGINSIDSGPPPTGGAPPVDMGPPPTTAKDQCPTGEQALALCLRFENSTRDESSRGLSLSVQRVGFDSGPTGAALALGDTSLVKVEDHQALHGPSFAIEAWVRPSRLPTGSQRMGIVDNEGRYGLFLLPGGTLACYAGSGSVQAADVVDAGAWTSVGCVSNGQTLSLWVQGTRRAQAGHTPAATGPSLGVTIGSNNPSGDNLVGLVDNVRLWSGARSQDELCAAALGCGDQ